MAAISTRPVARVLPSLSVRSPSLLLPPSPPSLQPYPTPVPPPLGLRFHSLVFLRPQYKSRAEPLISVKLARISLSILRNQTPKLILVLGGRRERRSMVSSDLSSGDGYESDGSGIGVRISSEVMVASVIFLFLVVIFVFFLYLYAKYYWGHNLPGRRRAHFIFAAGDAHIPSRGLDPSVLRSLPVSLYKRSDFKDGLECSVCLCEISEGEEVRLLPKCNHGFHLRCIDMWLHSHSTCPLCRCSLGQEAAVSSSTEAPPVSGSADAVVQPESPVFPTNVLFWGNQERVNTRGSFPHQATSGSSARSGRTLVISLPNRMVEGFPSPMSPLPSSRFPSENVKSPAEDARSPGTSKFRSLRRLWSRGKRTTGGSPCSSPMGGDIEQGFVGGYGHPNNGEGSSNVPKTPTAGS